MALWKSGALFILGFALVIGLLSMNFFWTVSKSLEYDVVKFEVASVLNNVSTANNVTIPQNYTEKAVHDIYYKNYTCKFLDCFGGKLEDPSFLVSKMSHDYFSSKFYFMIPIILIIIGLSFFLYEEKASSPLITGFLICITALPLLKMEEFFISFGAYKEFFSVFSIFFTRAYSVFFVMFTIGILLFLFGLAFKFWKIQEKIVVWWRLYTEERGKKKEEKEDEDEEEEKPVKKKKGK